MSKKTIKRIISLSLAASSLLGGTYQLGIDGNSNYVSSITAEAIAEECDCKSNSDYCVNCFIEKMDELTRAAEEYGVAVKNKKQLYINERYDLWFAFAYVRRLVYNKTEEERDEWGEAAGYIETDFSSFTNYLKENNEELYAFTSSINNRTTFHINEMQFDLAHMCATVSALLYKGSSIKSIAGIDYINELCGWGGDYQTLMNSAYKATYDDKKYDDIGVAFLAQMGENDSSFSTTDLFSDVVACEIGKVAKNDSDINMNTLLNSCLSSSSPNEYIAKFYKEISINDVLKLSKPYSIWGTRIDKLNRGYSFSSDDRQKTANAFVEYIKKYGEVFIAAQPKNAQAPIGGNVKTTVIAVGQGLTYQWYYKNLGMTEFKLSSIKSKTYDCPMTEDRDGRQVFCRIIDANNNSVDSDIVTLGSVVINEQPQNAQAPLGGNVKTTVIAVGEELTYQWYYKNPGMTEFKLSSIKSKTYDCPMTEDRDGRQVFCIITDKHGKSVQSNTVTLNSKVTITEDLVDVTAKFGEKVNFSVSATGHGLTYKWYFKNKNMKNFEVTETFKTNTYSFDQMTEARAGREVYCEITDIFGNTEKTKTIKIDLPTSYGDANCDGELTIDDADAIMKAFANPDQYGLTEQGKINADVSGEGDVTLSDALLIQQYFAN